MPLHKSLWPKSVSYVFGTFSKGSLRAAQTCCAAVLFGTAAVYSVLYPGPSGEWLDLAIFAAAFVNVPIGLVVGLGGGLFVRRGHARLRGLCVAVSLVVLSLPVLSNLIF